MMPFAIAIEDLSKQYRLGVRDPHPSFRRLLAEMPRAAVRRWRRLSGHEADDLFWALRHVSLEVRPGEVVGIIGPNGAGKSTLLKIVGRITRPTEGRVLLRGKVASLLEVGTGFHPELTGRENVYLNGAILGMAKSDIDRQFDAIVAFAETERFLDTPLKHYSSGMYLRLAFAVAAHLDPDILLVDEVLAVGDLAFQQKCLGKMQEVSGSGRTVLFVSHNLSAVSSLCGRALLLDRGVVAYAGAADETVKHYVSTSTRTGEQGWDLVEARRRHVYHGECMRLTHVEMIARRPPQVQLNEDLQFEVTFEATADRDATAVALAVDDFYGHRLVTFESHQAGVEIDVRRGRRYTVRLVVPGLALNPGRYLLSASVYSNRHYYDVVYHFGSFEVGNFDVRTGAFFEPTPHSGCLRLDQRWNVVPAADERAAASGS